MELPAATSYPTFVVHLLFLVALTSQVQVEPGFRNPAPSVPALGMNLAGVADWASELPFVDVFKTSRPWISQEDGKSWGQGPPLAVDERGWVKRLEPGCYAETLMCTIEGGHYPSGTYTLLYDGKGSIEFWNAGKIKSAEPGRILVDVDASKGAIFLRLRTTDSNDYVRNIRMLMPGFESNYQTEPFHPAFLQRWKDVRALRFMDWMNTNNSTIENWSQRPTLESATYSEIGVPVEVMVDLCNRLGADPWFCMPHRANDEYVRRFAEVVMRRLDPKLKIYLEYSNEVWNGMFAQHAYAGQRGIELGFDTTTWGAAWRYTAYRSKQMFSVWNRQSGRPERTVRVLASQAANDFVSEQILKFQDAYREADALAIAPYFGPSIGPSTTPNEATVSHWSVKQLLDHVEANELPQSIEWIRLQKAMATRHGLALIAYEGGQHLVGIQGSENNDALTQLLHAANRDPRMGTIYSKYLKAWMKEGGGLFANFSSISSWSKWGSWGLNQYADETASPKFNAVKQWGASLPRMGTKKAPLND